MNRYAWTDCGPVVIANGRAYSTKAIRAELLKFGINVDRWARNWAEFLGWIPYVHTMPEKAQEAPKQPAEAQAPRRVSESLPAAARTISEPSSRSL